MFKAKEHKILGGLRVILVQMPDSPTTTVEVMVETGSKYETKSEAGLSHFLEHMCFKGTPKRPSALEVSKEFDELGAVSNAYTNTENTAYWAKASYEHTLKIIDMVSDIYLNAIFKKEDLEKEKGVIIEEINMYEDQPQAMVGEIFDAAMHGDQPSGRPIIGNKKSVNGFNVDNFNKYRSKHYVLEATTVVVAGRFNEKDVLDALKKIFTNVSRTRKYGKKKTTISHRGARVVHKFKDTDQAHIILGVRAFPYKDKRNLPLSVLSGVLSSGMSSRLFHKMREELGICYYVYAHRSPSTDHGEFAVISGVDPKRIDVATGAIMEELGKLKTELIPKEELDKAKTSLVSKMRMFLETSDKVLGYFGDRALFYGDLKDPKELEKEIKAVTAEDIRKLAKEIFTNKDLLLAVVSKTANKAKLKKLLKF